MIRDLESYRTYIEAHLLDYLPEVEGPGRKLQEAMIYSLEAGGKRLRPALLLASCELAGGKMSDAIPYAIALEYIHTYSLIHDDLPCMDDDELRRGKPTNHVIFGAGIATLAGDGLLNSAFEAMNRDMFLYFDDPKELKARVRASYEIAKGAGVQGMVAGQTADLEAEGMESISEETLDYIHNRKTMAMIRAAVRAGAMIGNATDNLLSDLTNYGEALGLAFQIQDDILDVVGSAEEMGKNPGMDATHDKATYPAVYGLEEAYRRNDILCDRAIDCMGQYDEDGAFFTDLIEKVRQRRK